MNNRIIDFKVVIRICSNVLLITGFGFFVSLVVAIIYKESILPFVYSILLSVFPGLTLKLFTTRHNIIDYKLNRRNAYFTVAFSWVLLGLIGCLPYVFSSSMTSFTDAFFESVSGFSTTGASILTDIEKLPYSILFWRSLTHWIGGIGIILLVIVIMPRLQTGGYQLFSKESSLQEKFQPKVKSMGYRLVLIYVSLTLAQTILLIFGGMNIFESVCHSFGTVATGGFSPKNASLADYSPYIHYVTTIFMFLAGTNFVIHYNILKGNFKKAFGNEELKFYFIVVVIISLFIGIMLFIKTNKPFEESMRDALFQVVSIITCTGFVTTDYLLWPQYLWIILFFSMFLGGCVGSTAGGIKIGRHIIVFKSIRNMFERIILPRSVVVVRINNKVIKEETKSSVLGFFAMYILTFLVGATLLIFNGLDLQTASGATATCLAGIGPGIGSVGPVANFAHLPDFSKNLLSAIMVLGRLEIYTILVLFRPSFWRE